MPKNTKLCPKCIDSLLKKGKKEAQDHFLNIRKTEALFGKIEENDKFIITPRYRAIFYYICTNKYSPENLADMFYQSRKNIHSDLNKNLGQYLKPHLCLEDMDRLGITSLVRILKVNNFFFMMSDIEKDEQFVNILGKRFSENSQFENPAEKTFSLENQSDLT